jgi:hypothetical protein
MSKKKLQQDEQQTAGRAVYWIAIMAVFILGMVVAFSWYYFSQQRVRQAVHERQQYNEELGLSKDFPSDRVPIYPGLEILECERSNAKATTGEPMDKWYVHGQIDRDTDPIYEYYNDYFLEAGMRQTQYISIPTGYGVNYGDEGMVVEAVIEVRQGSDLTQVELTVYRVR